MISSRVSGRTSSFHEPIWMEVAAENPESAILEFAYRDAIVQVAASVVQSDKRDPNRRSIELHVCTHARILPRILPRERERERIP